MPNIPMVTCAKSYITSIIVLLIKSQVNGVKKHKNIRRKFLTNTNQSPVRYQYNILLFWLFIKIIQGIFVILKWAKRKKKGKIRKFYILRFLCPKNIKCEINIQHIVNSILDQICFLQFFSFSTIFFKNVFVVLGDFCHFSLVDIV